MKVYGKQIRDAAVVTFDLTIILLFPFHAVNALWFWVMIAVVTSLSALTVVGLELLRLVAPAWTDNFWDPE